MTTELVNTQTGETVGLEPLARAERMLAEIASAEDALDVINYAEAARVFAQRAKLGIGSVNHATVIKVCAEIRLAEEIEKGQSAGEIAKRGSAKGNQRTGKIRNPDVTTLEEIGVAPQRLNEARKMANKYTPNEVRSIAKIYSAKEKPLARWQLLNSEAIQQSVTNEWYTPSKYIESARNVLGGFDLDPASCAQANATVKADKYLTETEDGLEHDWHGTIWLNPPYGRLAGDFILRLTDQFDAGHVTSAIALINAHTTDTKWFQRLWDHTLCFTDHRIDFAAGTDARSGSTHGSVFAFLGEDAERFSEEFAQYGAVVRRWP